MDVVDRGIISVEDADGGWIAERFGLTLSRRDLARIADMPRTA